MVFGEFVEVGIRFGVGGVDRLQLLFGLHDFAQAGLHLLADSLIGVELGLLRQIADAQVGHRDRLAIEVLIDLRHDANQRRFAGAIKAEEADLCAGKKRKGNVFEDLALGRNHLADADQGIDVLRHALGRECRGEGKYRPSAPQRRRPGMFHVEHAWGRDWPAASTGPRAV